jgi:hypothetical protein
MTGRARPIENIDDPQESGPNMDTNPPAPEAADYSKPPAAPQAASAREQEIEFFITAPLRSARHLMDALYRDDSFYETARYAFVGPGDAKKLFLYGVGKEVTKTCVSMLEGKEHLHELPEEQKQERVTKLVLGAIIDTQTYRIRKMVELLSILVLFDRRAARDLEYRAFLNAESLDLELARLDDFRELYGGRVVANIDHSVTMFVERIEQDLTSLGMESLWFLKDRRFARKKPGIFESKKKLYLDALLVASSEERIALGISYGHGYSETSQAVHPLLGSHDYGREENAVRRVRRNFTHLGMAGIQVMHLAHRLAGIDDPHGIDKVVGRNFEKSEASNAIGTFSKELEVGDIVITAWTDIAEVLEIHTSKYSYTAVRVKYISRAPIPDIPEDWLESRSILLRLMPKSAIRQVFESAVTSERYPKEVRELLPEVLKLPDEELVTSAGKRFLELHLAGVLIPMLVNTGYLKRTDDSASTTDDVCHSSPDRKA